MKMIARLWRSLKDLFSSSAIYRRTAILSAVLVVMTALLPLWRILPLAKDRPYIPLHYNVYLGVDNFGPWYGIFVLPGLGLTLLVVNIVFETVFFRREHILSKFFAIATVIAEAVLLIAMILIVLLNL